MVQHTTQDMRQNTFFVLNFFCYTEELYRLTFFLTLKYLVLLNTRPSCCVMYMHFTLETMLFCVSVNKIAFSFNNKR